MASSNLPLFSPVLFLLLLGLLLAAVVVKPAPWRPLLWFAMVAIAAYLPFTTTHQQVVDYFLGSVYAGAILIGSDYILLHNPQVDFGQKNQLKSITDAPFAERFAWGLRLWSAQRGVGWTHEPKGIFRAPAPPHVTRSEFIFQKLRKMAVYLFLLDLGSIYNRTNPASYMGGPPLSSRPFIWRCLDLLAFAVVGHTQMSLLHSFVSICSVALGGSKPQDWKPPFGDWRDAYTIRRFWARVWHQFIRRPLSAHGKYLTHNVLRLEKGTNLSAYTQLFVAFFLSSLLHIVADYCLHHRFGFAYSGSLIFFMLQPFAIMAEDFVVHVARERGLDNGWKGWYYVGYVTTALWFVMTWPIWMEKMVDNDFMNEGLNMPVSIIMGVLKGQWKANVAAY